MSIVFHNANNFPVGQRKEDGYLNGTIMCQAHNRKIADWLRQESTLEVVVALADDLQTNSFLDKAAVLGEVFKGGISRLSDVVSVSDFKDLVAVKRGNPSTGGGTWLHPDLAVQLAQWCSPKFAIQVSRWIREWLVAGQNPVQQKPTSTEQTQILANQPIVFPPAPGWKPEEWQFLPLADQKHFSETDKQRQARTDVELLEMISYHSRFYFRR